MTEKKEVSENEELKNEPQAENEQKTESSPKFESLKAGRRFHKFSENPVFEGIFSGEALVAEKDTDYHKKGDLIGWLFEDLEGLPVVVPSAYAIDEAIQDEKNNVSEGDHFIITLVEVKKSAGGRKFNNFDIKRGIKE